MLNEKADKQYDMLVEAYDDVDYKQIADFFAEDDVYVIDSTTPRKLLDTLRHIGHSVKRK